MNNSVFRKTMENMRKRVNVELVQSKRDYAKFCAKPFKIFKEDLVIVNLRKRNFKSEDYLLKGKIATRKNRNVGQNKELLLKSIKQKSNILLFVHPFCFKIFFFTSMHLKSPF
jgi:hypothetical protein